jgi:5'-3' exonuclease
MGRECYKLATIKTDVALPFKLEDLVYQGYDYASVNDFAQKYELKQFLARLPISPQKGRGRPKSGRGPNDFVDPRAAARR